MALEALIIYQALTFVAGKTFSWSIDTRSTIVTTVFTFRIDQDSSIGARCTGSCVVHTSKTSCITCYTIVTNKILPVITRGTLCWVIGTLKAVRNTLTTISVDKIFSCFTTHTLISSRVRTCLATGITIHTVSIYQGIVC